MIEYTNKTQKTNKGFSQRVSELTSYAMSKEKLIDSACQKVDEQALVIETMANENARLRNHLEKAEHFMKKLYDQKSRKHGGSKRRPLHGLPSRPRSTGVFFPTSGNSQKKSAKHRPRSFVRRAAIPSPAPPASKSSGSTFVRKQKMSSETTDNDESTNEHAYKQALDFLSEPNNLQSGHRMKTFPPNFVRGVDSPNFHQFNEEIDAQPQQASKKTKKPFRSG